MIWIYFKGVKSTRGPRFALIGKRRWPIENNCRRVLFRLLLFRQSPIGPASIVLPVAFNLCCSILYKYWFGRDKIRNGFSAPFLREIAAGFILGCIHFGAAVTPPQSAHNVHISLLAHLPNLSHLTKKKNCRQKRLSS